ERTAPGSAVRGDRAVRRAVADGRADQPGRADGRPPDDREEGAMTGSALRVGIHDLAFATAHQVLDLGALAEHNGVDANKYYIGIGQTEMSVPAADEDIVTMGAQAAAQILERHGADGIRTLLFATESGIDQSKSAGVFVHSLLGMGENCRVVELKQACYS